MGTADLGRHRHVCGLFDGPQDAADALIPFMLEGLDRGERVVHLVEERDASLRSLAGKTEVGRWLESGQLDVRGWDESYLADGRFSSSRVLSYVRRSVRESPSLGFAGTRLIGDMEWAQETVPGVAELIRYERAVGAIVARSRTSVVCAYDVRRHPADRLADVVRAHDAVVTRGRLEPTPGSARPAPRDRILAAASLLFAEDGPAQTGIDAVIEAADVAKATLYRHFASKDALVVAWLLAPGTRWFETVRATAEARAATPTEVIPELFTALAEWLEADDFLGCPYLNTSAEISGTAHPASDAIRTYLSDIRAHLEACARAAGVADSARVAAQLHALVAGSISLGVATRSTAYALAARDAATKLLRAATTGQSQPRRRKTR